MNSKTQQYRQQIADTFIKSLEEKQLEWKKEWAGQSMIPMNAITDKRYKGINKFWLAMSAMTRKTDDPRWCTFKQLYDKGWKLNKGAKGEQIEYWMPYDKEAKKGITWEDYSTRKAAGDEAVTLSTKYYTVFNGKDITGIPPLPSYEINQIEPDEIIAKLSTNMGVEIINNGGDRAFYRPSEDTIHLPLPGSFKTSYAYNATALHELAHATGAAHRLNRNIMNLFGSSSYAYEELIAEISSCFMSANLSMPQDQAHLNNHKAYVQSWIQAIREKPETLIKAIREAERTATFMDYKAELMTENEYKATLRQTAEVNETEKQAEPKAQVNPTLETSKAAPTKQIGKNTEKLLSFAEIRQSGEEYIQNIMSEPSTLAKLLEHGHIMRYGLHNAIFIQLQNPDATQLYTTTEIFKNGAKLHPGQKPIFIYTPIDKPYFHRGDQIVRLRDATPDEQLKAVAGKLTIHHDITYKAHPLYDVSQIIDPSMLQEVKPDLELKDLIEFAQKCDIKTTESKFIGVTASCIYDPDNKSIIVTGSQCSTADYIESLAKAVVDKTCTMPQDFMEMCQSIVALNVVQRLQLDTPDQLLSRLPSMFAAKSFDVQSVFAYTTKASSFINKGLLKTAENKAAALQQEQSIKQSQKQQPSKEQSTTMENFLKEI